MNNIAGQKNTDIKSAELKYSVVVPVYNRSGLLRKCLTSLTNQTCERDTYEIIVVDDGSEEDIASVVKEFTGVHYYRQERGGASKGRNLGARNAKGKYLLFTDADCEPAPDWIERMMDGLGKPGVIGVKGVYRTRQREITARVAQTEYEDKYRTLEGLDRIDFVDTYSAGYLKEAFLGEIGFNETLKNSGAEDIELSFRMARRGYKLIYHPAAWVYHNHPDTLLKYMRVKIRNAKWRVVVYKWYPEKILSTAHTPNSLKIELVLVWLALAMIALGWWWIGAAVLCAALIVSSSWTLQVARKDKRLVVFIPLYVVVRAISQGLGIIIGTGMALSGKYNRSGG